MLSLNQLIDAILSYYNDNYSSIKAYAGRPLQQLVIEGKQDINDDLLTIWIDHQARIGSPAAWAENQEVDGETVTNQWLAWIYKVFLYVIFSGPNAVDNMLGFYEISEKALKTITLTGTSEDLEPALRYQDEFKNVTLPFNGSQYIQMYAARPCYNCQILSLTGNGGIHTIEGILESQDPDYQTVLQQPIEVTYNG